MEQKGVRNIIFDLGEVITDIHFDKTIKAFEKLAGGDVSHLYQEEVQNELFHKIEKGLISPKEFLNHLREKLGNNISEENVKTAWNAMIGDTPWERLEFVNELRPKYKTYILSNTNAIHIEYLNKTLQDKYQLKNLDPFFDKVYYSHELGYRKPDSEIYQMVLEKENLLPEQTLFVDDREDNIKAAQLLGLHTLHLIKKKILFDLQ